MEFIRKLVMDWLALIFQKNKSSKPLLESVLSEEIDIKCHISSQGDIFIYGIFRGIIHSDGTVFIGSKGSVKGKIISDSLIIENGGYFEGSNMLLNSTEENI